jgi:hypothetical protein
MRRGDIISVVSQVLAKTEGRPESRRDRRCCQFPIIVSQGKYYNNRSEHTKETCVGNFTTDDELPCDPRVLNDSVSSLVIPMSPLVDQCLSLGC